MLRRLIRTLAVLTLLTSPALAENVAFQSRLTGSYVGTDGSGLLVANARPEDALVLEMIRLDGHRVAFRDRQSGAFLRAGVGQETYLAVRSPHIRGWETFEMVQDGPDVTLRAVQNGLYVGTNGTQRLTARWGTQGLGQTFRIVPVGAPAAQPPVAAPAPQPAAQAPAQQPADQLTRITQDLAFAGRWVLDDLLMPELNDRAMRRVTLAIGPRGALSGFGGCNSYDAFLFEWRSAYRVQQMSIPDARCRDMITWIERAFIDALTDAAHFHRSGDRLEIRDWNGRVRARLIRARR